jgi:transaldolase
MSSNSPQLGRDRRQGNFPKGHRSRVGIWLWGDPAEICDYLELGVVGLVTNTIVLDQLTDKYGRMEAVVDRYLELPHNGPVVVEVDGDTADEMVRVSKVFTAMSPRVVLKIPCSSKGLRAVVHLGRDGHKCMVTTTFSVSQAVAAAAAGAAYIAPFIGPTIDSGADAAAIIGDIVRVIGRSEDSPYLAAGIVRTTIAADTAIRAGCDGIVISPAVYEEMLLHPGTTEWNATFRRHWDRMADKGALDGADVKSLSGEEEATSPSESGASTSRVGRTE